MKNYIYILVCLFIYFSCKSQEKAIEYENENLIIFKDFDPTIKVIDNNMSVHLLTYKNLIFVKDRIYSDIPRPMKLSFVKDKDTMNIVLNYGNWSNIYVKNFKFKNGNYQIVTNINSKSDDLTECDDFTKSLFRELCKVYKDKTKLHSKLFELIQNA